MNIRLEVDDDLYVTYKELADKKAYQVTKLNRILFEEVIGKWIEENKK